MPVMGMTSREREVSGGVPGREVGVGAPNRDRPGQRRLGIQLDPLSDDIEEIPVGQYQPAECRTERRVETLARQERGELGGCGDEAEVHRIDQVGDVVAERVDTEARAAAGRRELQAYLPRMCILGIQ